jgi:LEA14-like dessication related protein
MPFYCKNTFHNIFPIIIKSIKNKMSCNTLHLAKGYDPLYSSSPLASLDGFSRSHGLYVTQLVVAATNQNALYKKHMFCRKNVNKIKMRVHIK